MTTLTITTRRNKWVIPHNCELLKALVSVQGLNAEDLIFHSTAHCQQFIHDLALLATKDELSSGEYSPLTPLTQQLVALQTGEHFRGTQITI